MPLLFYFEKVRTFGILTASMPGPAILDMNYHVYTRLYDEYTSDRIDMNSTYLSFIA